MDALDGNQVDELSALLALSKGGSFVAAGRTMNRHPTIVSKRIAALEQRLGVRLVERTTRRVVLTDAGARLADQIDAASAILNEAEQEATAGAAELHGALKVSLPAAMGRLWIAPELPEFSRLYPKLTVEVDFSERYADLVGEGFDVAIRMGALADSRLMAKRLGAHRVRLAASRDYLDAWGTPERPSDLVRHNALVYSGPIANPNWRFARGSEREGVTPHGTVRSNDISALLDMARGGIGIVAVGEWALARDFASGALVGLLPDWRYEGDGGIYIVRQSARFAPARTEAFIAWVQDVLWPRMPW